MKRLIFRTKTAFLPVDQNARFFMLGFLEANSPATVPPYRAGIALFQGYCILKFSAASRLRHWPSNATDPVREEDHQVLMLKFSKQASALVGSGGSPKHHYLEGVGGIRSVATASFTLGFFPHANR